MSSSGNVGVWLRRWSRGRSMTRMTRWLAGWLVGWSPCEFRIMSAGWPACGKMSRFM